MQIYVIYDNDDYMPIVAFHTLEGAQGWCERAEKPEYDPDEHGDDSDGTVDICACELRED